MAPKVDALIEVQMFSQTSRRGDHILYLEQIERLLRAHRVFAIEHDHAATHQHAHQKAICDARAKSEVAVDTRSLRPVAPEGTVLSQVSFNHEAMRPSDAFRLPRRA